MIERRVMPSTGDPIDPDLKYGNKGEGWDMARDIR